jgi:hypothetical protein
VYGLEDLIEGRDMQSTAKFEVQPQAPVSAAMRAEACKQCGKTIFIPSDREMFVLGFMCHDECENNHASAD